MALCLHWEQMDHSEFEFNSSVSVFLPLLPFLQSIDLTHSVAVFIAIAEQKSLTACQVILTHE